MGSEEFSDQALKIDFKHDSEYWRVNASHQDIGKDFRADLGFMTKADYQKDSLLIDKLFYAEQDSIWQEAKLSAQWQILHNEEGELLERSIASSFSIDGPKLSFFDVMLTFADKVGLRHDDTRLAIDGNTSRFSEKQIEFYGTVQPTSRIYASASLTLGDKIDYANNRLGDFKQFQPNITFNVTDHLEIDLFHTYSKLDFDGSNVYTANLTDLRVSYQFDVQSYLKLSLVYSDIDRNPNNNPNAFFTKKDKNVSTQLIYSYKLNPQTVFFLGYSDNSIQDDSLNNLERNERTFFTKISYAWTP